MKREAAKSTQDKAAKPSQQGRSDREQELAATKIQSQIRGKQARCGMMKGGYGRPEL